MKRYILILFLFPTFCFSQNVGINTDTPKATLDVVSSLSTSDFDGLIIPRVNSLDNTVTAAQDGLLVFLTADWSNGTSIFKRGFYYYDHGIGYANIWTSINHTNPNTIGDIKTGMQTADHNGWYILDGRTVTSLPSNAQVAANSLGYTLDIPNATGKVLMQNNTPGITGGNTGNQVSIGQVNLPSLTFNGSSNFAGNHNHSASSSSSGNHSHSASTGTAGNHGHNFYTANNDVNSYESQGYPAGNNHLAFRTTDRRQQTRNNGNIIATGNHTHSVSIGTSGIHNHSILVNNNGNHNHTVNVNSGGSDTPLNITPEFLGVSVFIYLGL